MNTNQSEPNPWLRFVILAAAVLVLGVVAVMTLTGCSSSGGSKPAKAAEPASSSAATSSSPAAAAPAVLPGVFGQTMFTNSGVKVVANTPTVAPKESQWASQPGSMCVSFQVAVINNSAAALPGPGAWELRGTDGVKYSLVDRCGSAPVQGFPDGALPPQGVAAGAVVFIGPEHGVLRYTPYNDAAGTISWTF